MTHERPHPSDLSSRIERERLAVAAAPEYTVITVITQDTPLGGAIYPFLEATGRAWSLITHTLRAPVRAPVAVTFGSDTPTLRWVNGNDVVDVFVEGLNTAQFLATRSLELSLDKGGYVLSKRLSRLMRPYFASGFFPEHAVNVTYLDSLDRAGQQRWDGAGLIARRLLERFALPPGVSPAKRAALERHLRRCQRVEFTLMTSQGQDKGHALVVDDLPTDVMLPRATKGEVKLRDGTRFVGINFLHAHERMHLDIQSLINLHPFFAESHLGQWLSAQGQVFIQAVQSGAVAEAMGRIEHLSGLEEVERWPLREYFASGGQPLWFAEVVKNLMNQHLDQLNQATLAKLRLPVPGGRFYVMPIGVGQAAGVDFDVPRGHVCLDRPYATAWVNDQDWSQLDGAPVGIAGLLGGADNDDALWVHSFTDYDKEPKVLCWRSPNQVGEYVVLQPTLGSYPLEWPTPEGVVQYPPGDSRQLPPRKDTRSVTFPLLNPPQAAGRLGEGQPYSIAAMNATLERAWANAGTLGLYCNLLMIHQAINGSLPAHLPAELEAVIDGSVKTGVDLSAVRQWCYAQARHLLDSHTPLPAILTARLPGSDTHGALTLTQTHWLDRLVAAVTAHIRQFEQQRDALAQEAMPPAVIFDHVFHDEELAQLPTGAGLHQAYHNTLRLLRRQKSVLAPEDYEMARTQAEMYLNQFPPEAHHAILRAAIVSGYMQDQPRDKVLWLSGAKSGHGRRPGIAHQTIQTLRELGLLDEIGHTSEGLLAYPGALVSTPRYGPSIGITGVWFNWWRHWQQAHGHPLAEAMADVSRARAQWAKAQVAVLAQSAYRNLPLTITADGERKVAWTQAGEIFGFISKDSTATVPDGEILLYLSISQDGNLRSLWRFAEP